MKTFGYTLVLAALQLPSALAAAVRVIEIGENAEITPSRIYYFSDGIEQSFRCDPATKKVFAFNPAQTVVACCDEGQHLSGGPETEYHCCGAGHSVAGTAATGYACCPDGQLYNGSVCYAKTPVCTNGKVLVGGECVCPEGTVENAAGGCTKTGTDGDDGQCTSGVETGKCYLFRMENGEFLGFHNAGWYTASRDSRDHNTGKFKFCKDEECTAGLPVNPGDKVHLKDLHGRANSGTDANQWLNGAVNGGHIGKTPNFSSAGAFTVTKWYSCRYCLSGFDQGLGPTCPSNDPAMTFLTRDTQSCQSAELLEVPCDIRAPENNCLWKKCKNKPCC